MCLTELQPFTPKIVQEFCHDTAQPDKYPAYIVALIWSGILAFCILFWIVIIYFLLCVMTLF